MAAIPICIIGNLIPIPFILLLITKIFDWMKGTKKLKPMVEKHGKNAMSKSANIEKYEFGGLLFWSVFRFLEPERGPER